MSEKPAVRLFRADTPHDVASAAIVAGTLPPGRDLLAFSTDKTNGDRRRFAQTMRVMAGSHPWSAVLDISGLPMAPHMMSAGPPASRLRRVQDTAASLRQLRRILAPALGLDPNDPEVRMRLACQVDELYVNCVEHPDVQAVYALFPSARKNYYPHGFDSIQRIEAFASSRFCSGTSGTREPVWRSAADTVKRLLFGADAVLPRRLPLDAAYSFNFPLEWAAVQHDLRSCLDRKAMARLFALLPGEVRGYYEELAGRCRGTTALLLLPGPYGFDSDFKFERAAEAVATLARKIVSLEHPAALLLKPHPRNSARQIDRIMALTTEGLPGTRIVQVREYYEYPIEIVLAPFRIRACGAFGSSSLRSLRTIYGTTSYCPEKAMLDLYSDIPNIAQPLMVWVEENRAGYVAV